MGVDGQLATELDTAALDERAALAARTEARLLELLQDLEREAVVDLGEVDVARREPGLGERLGCSDAEAGHEDVLAVGDLIGRIGLAGGDTEDRHGLAGEVARTLGGGDDDRSRTVGLQAAVE